MNNMPVVSRDSRQLRIGKLDDLIGSQVGELALEEFDLVNSTLRGLPRGNLRRVSIDVCDFAVLLFSIIAARANRPPGDGSGAPKKRADTSVRP
jgi:hypothetical protein